MVKLNEDGIKVIGEMVYFDDWLKIENGMDSESIRSEMLCDGASEEEVDEYISELEESFYEYCDINGYCGEII